MPGTQQIPTSAVESIDAYLTDVEKFVSFVASTTADEVADAQLWCRYVGLALHELTAATLRATSYLIGYAVVSGITPTAAATASDLSYYLARTALLDVPALASRLPNSKVVKADHITVLQAEGLEVIGDFGPFAPETTYWQSWFDPSKQRARITSALRAAVGEWLDTISHNVATAREHTRSDILDAGTWSLRLLKPISQVRNTLIDASNHSVRFAFDIGMVDSGIAQAFHFGRRSLEGRIEGTRSLIADDSDPLSPSGQSHSGRIGPTVTISTDGDRVVIMSGPAIITHGATYSEALRTLYRRASVEQCVRYLLVIGNAVPPSASVALMERYNLERIDFAETLPAVAA